MASFKRAVHASRTVVLVVARGVLLSASSEAWVMQMLSFKAVGR
jgi:hypothetical protein